MIPLPSLLDYYNNRIEMFKLEASHGVIKLVFKLLNGTELVYVNNGLDPFWDSCGSLSIREPWGIGSV